jgi:outer membrane lipase/esterase
MIRRALVAVGVICGLNCGAAAQNFNQAIIFGDSNVDSGWYKYRSSGSTSLALDAQIAAHPEAGAPTTNPGFMNSQFLAAFFGLTANPADAPSGGTNYATSGAKNQDPNSSVNGGFRGAVPTNTQIANYLAATGGVANPNALYLINSGANDISYALGNSGNGPYPTNPNAYLDQAAQSLTQAVAKLKAAGARYFIVPDQPFSFPLGNSADNMANRAARLFYSQALWSDLAAAGINFVPADINAVRVAIAAAPSAFGFQFINSGNVVGPVVNANGQAACNTYNPAVTTAWALGCTPANLVSADAMQTHLFADDQHLTTAGQKIFADYYYSLLVAPSQISFLAENAVKARTRFISLTQNQIEASQTNRGPSGINAWVSGDVSHLSLDNYRGFPDDPSTPLTLTAGVDLRVAPHILVGAVISVATQRSTFSTTGDFTQDELAGGLYAAFRGGPWWGDIIASYGRLDYSVNRNVPIGITLQLNNGSTSGHNWSVAAEGGYKFHSNWITHGPVAGLTLQRVSVDGFTETGSFTSLAFADQTRDSLISALGYRASLDWGAWRPFAQVVWNHELADTDRNVTAFLTTVTAPGFALPAVSLGKDWGTGTLGATVKLAPNVTALGTLTAEFAQRDAVNYGAQLGLNVAF